MRKQFFTYLHTDLIGFSASLICAVHCSLLPVILTLSAFSSLTWLSHPWFEGAFIASSIVIATFALGKNFRKHVHIRRSLQIIAAGFVFIILSRIIHGEAHHYLAAIGGMIIAIGHIYNWRQSRKSACCATH